MDEALGRCPYCHEDVKEKFAFVSCRACLARHHGSCWLEHGGCSSCGEERCLAEARPRAFENMGWLTPAEIIAGKTPRDRARTARALRITAWGSWFVAAVLLAMMFALAVAGEGAETVWFSFVALFMALFMVAGGVWIEKDRKRWLGAVAPRRLDVAEGRDRTRPPEKERIS